MGKRDVRSHYRFKEAGKRPSSPQKIWDFWEKCVIQKETKQQNKWS